MKDCEGSQKFTDSRRFPIQLQPRFNHKNSLWIKIGRYHRPAIDPYSPLDLATMARVRNVKNQVLKLNSFITVACYLC